MKKLLLLLILVIASPKIGINVDASQNPSYWVWDGIHPTAAGHQKMADLWLNTVRSGMLASISTF
jgi:phospholipase/lecithinase/hemolysin